MVGWKMKICKFLILLTILTFCQSAIGVIVAAPSLSEYIESSDYIVIGKLSDVVEFSKWRTDYFRGVITIEKTILGNIKSGEKLVFEYKTPRSSSLHFENYKEELKDNTVWLLRLNEEGFVHSVTWSAKNTYQESEIRDILSQTPEKNTKEYTPVTTPEIMLNQGKPFISFTLFALIIIIVIKFTGMLALKKTIPDKREVVNRMIRVLVITTVILLIVYWHVRIYDWVFNSINPFWNAAFVILPLAIFWITIILHLCTKYSD
jgi:hypothetical protein